MHLKIHEIAHHRNGIGGVPFDAVKFTHTDGEEPDTMMLAIVMELDGEAQKLADEGKFYNPPTAVMALDKLAEGDIAFGSNSYRGDNFDATLRAAIEAQSLEDYHALIAKQGAQA